MEDSSSTGLYTRHASGLVRDIGFGSSIVLTMSFMSLPLAALVATSAPSLMSGAPPLWVSVAAAVVAFAPVYLYSYFLGLMPRSGGDYVFISRTLHPWIGFAANFALIAWLMLAATVILFQVAPFGLSAGFATISFTTGSDTLGRWAEDVATDEWSFWIGVALLAGTALVMLLPVRRVLQVIWIIFGMSVVGVALSLVILLFSGHETFVNSVAEHGGNYSKVIADARSAGWTDNTTFANFIWALPLAFVAYGFAIPGAYAGGEIRSPRTRGRQSLIAAWAIFAVVGCLLMLLATRTIGTDFLGAATFLSDGGSKEYPFAAPSFLFLYVAMLVDWTPLVVLISLSFSFALLAIFPPTFLIASRSLFAWSFDRILPTGVSTVSRKNGAPIVAVAVLFVLCLGYLYLVAFGAETFFSLFFSATMGQMITFMILGIAGIVLPFRRPDLFESGPVRRRVAGIPVVSLVAAAATAVWAFVFIALATQDELGANTTTGWTAVAVIAAVGICIYPVAYLVNRSRGVDLGLAFKELPPE